MRNWHIIDDCEQFIAKCKWCGYIVDSRMIPKVCPKCGAGKGRGKYTTLYYAQIIKGHCITGSVTAELVGDKGYSFMIKTAPSPQLSRMLVDIPAVTVDITEHFIIGKSKEAVIDRLIENIKEEIGEYQQSIDDLKKNLAEAYAQRG